MRARDYTIMQRAVEEGVAAGWHRAHKHTDRPGEDAVCSAIWSAVTDAISEVFDFDETSGDARESDLASTGRDRSSSPPVLDPSPSFGATGFTAAIGEPRGPRYPRQREQQAAKKETTGSVAKGRGRGQREWP